ncbi:MAG: helix-turn-helix transcriptional regulator [Actinomycetota bacterium]|nr:helix-turn-helix transcriptional regulator [Actinomycetota bacterium]
MARREVGYRWHLRRLMAEREMFATTDLQPLLAERGVQLSAAQIYRLVTGTPERLNLRLLAALCDILACTPAELIEPTVQTRPAAKRATAAKRTSEDNVRRPRRARIVDET